MGMWSAVILGSKAQQAALDFHRASSTAHGSTYYDLISMFFTGRAEYVFIYPSRPLPGNTLWHAPVGNGHELSPKVWLCISSDFPRSMDVAKVCGTSDAKVLHLLARSGMA